jgi:hypothetical protein
LKWCLHPDKIFGTCFWIFHVACIRIWESIINSKKKWLQEMHFDFLKQSKQMKESLFLNHFLTFPPFHIKLAMDDNSLLLHSSSWHFSSPNTMLQWLMSTFEWSQLMFGESLTSHMKTDPTPQIIDQRAIKIKIKIKIKIDMVRQIKTKNKSSNITCTWSMCCFSRGQV